MASADKSAKDKMMAAHLKSQGIFHGVRTTSSKAPCVPNMKDVGSAKYRRYLEYLQKGKKSRKNDTQRRKEWER